MEMTAAPWIYQYPASEFNKEKRCYYVGENCKGLPDHICQSAGQSGEGREKQFGEVLLHYWVRSIGIIRDPHRRGPGGPVDEGDGGIAGAGRDR